MKRLAFALIAIAISLPASAKYVRDAQVVEGKAKIYEGMSFSDYDKKSKGKDDFKNELEISYGVTDYLALEAALLSIDKDYEDFDIAKSIEFGAKFKLFDEGEYRPVTALRLSYLLNTTGGKDTDEFGVMGIFGKKIGQFDNLANIQFTKTVGENAEGGIGLNLAARSYYIIDEQFSFGPKYFGEFGQLGEYDYDQQKHTLGPALVYKPAKDMYASVTYLAGISDKAPDSTIKFEMGISF